MSLEVVRGLVEKTPEFYNDYLLKTQTIFTPVFEKFAKLEELDRECKQMENVLKSLNCTKPCTSCNSKEFDEKFGIEVKQVKKTEQENAKCNEKENEKEEETKENNSTKKEAEQKKMVPALSAEEFKTIPKYMLGRLTHDNLNELAMRIDEFLSLKQKLHTKPNKALTREDRDSLDKWKELERKSKKLTTNLFCIESDIKPLLSEKLRPSFGKMIPCLRHVRRIREERCGPTTFYYV
ncbi:unnamed protein product [Caenorhabditis bovis]|uniref:SKA complex subunit 1 n=1 Tax=Caenorhabditis bovis TaxID=2654633 RepID=A0A8S1F780_9PELO|nr:unnamed protein product [Caenorhabditis bovis]